jgi:two-component system sensor histidine kinase and response regulator WspE
MAPSPEASGVDPALLELFRAEMEIHTPALSQGLLELEKDPSQTAGLEALMRAAHSIKGAARIVGMDAAVQLAHVMEDCFVAAREGRIALTSDAVDVLLRGVDTLGRVPQDATDLAFVRLVEAVGAVRSGHAPVPAPAVSAPPPEPKPAGPVTVSPQGDLDAKGAEELRRSLADRLAQGTVPLRLDLACVGSVGPQALAVLALLARAAGPSVELTGAAPAVQTLLQMTRLDRAFRPAAGGP